MFGSPRISFIFTYLTNLTLTDLIIKMPKVYYSCAKLVPSFQDVIGLFIYFLMVKLFSRGRMGYPTPQENSLEQMAQPVGILKNQI